MNETQKKQNKMNKKVFICWPSLLDWLTSGKAKMITTPVGMESCSCWALRRQWRRPLQWEDQKTGYSVQKFLGNNPAGERGVRGIYPSSAGYGGEQKCELTIITMRQMEQRDTGGSRRQCSFQLSYYLYYTSSDY